MAHEHARKDETNIDKPRAPDYVPRRRTGARPGKRGMDVSRRFSSYRAKGERTPGEEPRGVERRIEEGRDGGKVPANVLEMSQKENSDVGRDLSGSKCIT